MLSSARISHLLVAGALLATQGMAMDDPGTGEPGQTEFEDAGGVGNWDSTSSTTDPEGSQMESMGSEGETPLAGPPVTGDAGGEGAGGEGAGDEGAGDAFTGEEQDLTGEYENEEGSPNPTTDPGDEPMTGDPLMTGDAGGEGAGGEGAGDLTGEYENEEGSTDPTGPGDKPMTGDPPMTGNPPRPGSAFTGDSEGGMPAVAPSSGPSSGHASNGNFGEWNFKSPSSSVYKVDGSQYCGAGTEWNGSHCIVTYDSFIRGCSQNSNGKWKCTVQKAQDCNGD